MHESVVTHLRPIVRAVAPLASAGSTQSDAALITGTAPVVNISGGDGTKGAILPPSSRTGTEITIYNSGAGALKVYPPSGGTINGGAANASISVAAKGVSRLVAIDQLNNWVG